MERNRIYSMMNIFVYSCVCLAVYSLAQVQVLALKKLSVCVDTKEKLEDEIRSPSVGYSDVPSSFTIERSVSTEPQPYLGDKYCLWQFKIDYVMQAITLEFEDFDLQDDPGCRKEYVKVIASDDKDKEQKFCGRSFPKDVMYAISEVKMVFFTDSARNGSSFRIVVSEGRARCYNLQTLSVDTVPSYLYSPGYPNNYFSYLDCYWHLWKKNKSEVIMLEFLSFYLQGYEPDCSSDSLKISSDSTNKVICGYHNRFLMKIPDDSVYVTLKTDSSLSHEGFVIKYYSLPNYPVTCYNSTVTRLKALRNKPRFVSSSDIDCLWEITAESPADVIILQVLLADDYEFGVKKYQITEMIDFQTVDLVEFIDKTIGYYRSATNQIKVRMIKDPYKYITLTNRKIFSFSFHSIQKDEFTKVKIQVDRPVHIYIPPVDYNLDVVEQATVRIETNHECVEASVLTAQRSELTVPLTKYFEFYDGDSVDSHQLEGICRGYTNSISGHHKNMVIRRKKDSLDTKGYWLVVKRTSSCIGVTSEITLAPRNEIFSPGYPEPLDGKLFCQWEVVRLSALNQKIISVTANPEKNKTDQADQSSVCSERLTINYGVSSYRSPRNFYWCYEKKEEFLVDRDRVLVTLNVTDNSTKLPAFKLAVSLVDQKFLGSECHYEIDLKLNQPVDIVSPFFDGGYAGDIDCKWTLKAESRFDVINFTINSLNVESTDNCVFTTLQVYDDDVSSKREYCRAITKPITSQYLKSNVTVIFRRKFTGYSSGFNATVTATNISARCDGRSLKVGSEPRYLIATNKNSQIGGSCYFYLNSDNDLKDITVEVIDFNLPDCKTGSIILYDGKIVSSDKKLGTVCGTDNVDYLTLFTTNSGHMVIYFSSSASQDVHGFKLKYYLRNKEINNWMLTAHLYPQYFTSPNYPKSYGRNKYTWIIGTDAGKRVEIEVKECVLGYDNQGNRDSVRVFDGAMVDESKLLREFSTVPSNEVLTSNGSHLVVQLVSEVYDDRANKKLRIKYNQIFEVPLTGSTGTNSSQFILVSTIGVVATLLAIIIFFSCCCLCSRRKGRFQRSSTDDNHNLNDLHHNPLSSPSTPSATPALDPNAPPPDYLEARTISPPSHVIIRNRTSIPSEPPPSYEESGKYEVL